MSKPSFLYSGINSNISALAETLDRLGGGDAKVSGLEVHALIGSASDGDTDSVLWTGDRSVGIRNIDMPASAPAAAATRYFEVSSASPLVRRDMLVLDSVPHNQIYQWLSDGFNASVITYGERLTFKTSTMFGNAFSGGRSMVQSILQSLYEESKVTGLTIGLSCWSLCGNDVTDLLDPNGRRSGHIDTFTGVACPDLDTAMSAIRLARDRCPGARAYDSSQALADSERAHFFCRIALHNPDRTGGRISFLHVVDLVGTAPVGDVTHSRVPQEKDRISRRVLGNQLSTLSKVLHEMKELSIKSQNSLGHDHEGSSYSSEVRLTSARESKLTQMLAPILMGNNKTWLLCFLRNGERHYQQSINSLRALNGLTHIKCACNRVKNVSVGELHLLPHRHVLPLRQSPRTQQPSSPQQQQHYSPTPKRGMMETRSDQDDRNSDPEQDSLNGRFHDEGPLLLEEERLESYEYKHEHQRHIDIDMPHESATIASASSATTTPRFVELMEQFNQFKDEYSDSAATQQNGHTAPPAPAQMMQSRSQPLRTKPDYEQHSMHASQADRLTPYYHTTASHLSQRTSPIEELARELDMDVHRSSAQFNQSRDEFDTHQFSLMEQHTRHDEWRHGSTQNAEAIQAEHNYQHNTGSSRDAEKSVEAAREFARKYLENQGQYSSHQNSRADRDIYRPSEEGGLRHSEEMEWFDASRAERMQSNDPTNINVAPDRGSHHVNAAYAYGSRYDDNQEYDNEDVQEIEDLPYTAAMAKRASDDSMQDANRSGEPVDQEVSSGVNIYGFNGEDGLSKEVRDLLAGRTSMSKDNESLSILNQSLLNALRTGEKIQDRLKDKIDEVRLEKDEALQQMALHIDDVTLECTKLRQLTRRMAEESNLADTLQFFENEMKNLSRENAELRRRNLVLEEFNEKAPDPLTSEAVIRAKRDAGDSGTDRDYSRCDESVVSASASKKGKLFSPANSDVTWSIMDGMTSRTGSESAEIRVLKGQLKKVKLEYEQLNSSIDKMKRAERHDHMTTKLYNDCSKKLLFANAELDRLSKEVDFERDQRFQRERDIGILQSEIAVLQSSERELRNERSRVLTELASARQEIREHDIERARFASYDRFVQKHTASKWGDKQTAPKTVPKSTMKWGDGPTCGSPGSKSKPVHSNQQQSARFNQTGTRSRSPAASVSRTMNNSGRDIINESNQHLVVSSFDTPGLASRMMVNNTHNIATPSMQQRIITRSEPTSTRKTHPPELPIERQVANNSKGILKLSSSNTSSLMNLTESEIEESIAKGVAGVAGLSNAQYLRLEEAEPMSPALEQSLLALHDIVALTSPNLLPLVGKLGTELKTERALSLQQRAAMMAQMQKQQYLDASRQHGSPN